MSFFSFQVFIQVTRSLSPLPAPLNHHHPPLSTTNLPLSPSFSSCANSTFSKGPLLSALSVTSIISLPAVLPLLLRLLLHLSFVLSERAGYHPLREASQGPWPRYINSRSPSSSPSSSSLSSLSPAGSVIPLLGVSPSLAEEEALRITST